MKSIREIAVDLTSQDYGTEQLERVLTFLSLAEHDLSSRFIALLHGAIGKKEETALLLSCLSDDGRFSATYIFDQFWQLPYERTSDLRAIMSSLPRQGIPVAEARVRIIAEMELLVSESGSLASPDVIDKVRHILFLEETFLVDKKGDSGMLVDTIAEISSASGRSKFALSELHLEYLKRSQWPSAWKYLIAPTRTQTVRQLALDEIKRARITKGSEL